MVVAGEVEKEKSLYLLLGCKELWQCGVSYGEGWTGIMAETIMNGKLSQLYLRIIATLCAILLGIMAWSMNGAVTRNEADHILIKAVQATKAEKADINDLKFKMDKLYDAFNNFAMNAPPPHIHLDDGNGSVRRTIK